MIRVEPPGSGGEDITGDRDGPDFRTQHRNMTPADTIAVLTAAGPAEHELAAMRAEGAI